MTINPIACLGWASQLEAGPFARPFFGRPFRPFSSLDLAPLRRGFLLARAVITGRALPLPPDGTGRGTLGPGVAHKPPRGLFAISGLRYLSPDMLPRSLIVGPLGRPAVAR